MKRKKVEKIVEAALPAMIRRLGLVDWDISVEVGSCSSSSAQGRVTILTPYRSAYVSLENRLIDSESEALRVLRHELIHLVLGSSRNFLDAVRSVDTIDQVAQGVLEESYRQNDETNVTAIERVLDLCGATPEALAGEST